MCIACLCVYIRVNNIARYLVVVTSQKASVMYRLQTFYITKYNMRLLVATFTVDEEGINERTYVERVTFSVVSCFYNYYEILDVTL